MERVRIEDVQAAAFCVRGARRWFEGHGLDFAAFLADGVEADVLLATKDPLAVKVVEHKRGRHG